MAGVRVALVAGLLVLIGTIVWAVGASPVGLGENLAELWSEPWGRTTLVDLYLGFLMFGGYVWWRERSAGRGAALLVATCLVGNVVPALYLLWVLRRGGSLEVLGRVSPCRGEGAAGTSS